MENNTNSNFTESLEFLRSENIELKNTRAYRLGVKLDGLFTALKRGKLGAYLRKQSNYKKIAKYASHITIPNDNFVYGAYPQKKKFVIYTCITGNYDNLLPPLYVHPDIDYVAYTDNDLVKSSIWDIRRISDSVNELNDNTLINRYFKFHPCDLFPNYDYAIYIDGNMRVVSDLRNMVNRINVKTGLAFHRHGVRNCIYKEAEVCRIIKKGNYKKISEQLKRYEAEGFPHEFGLYEANVILTDLRNSEAKRLLEAWWKEFCRSDSFRDQIALPYVIWSCGYKFDDIGSLGFHVNNNPKFEKVEHI